MSEIIFQRERLTPELLDQIIEMGQDHFKEVATFQDLKPNVNRDYYQMAEDQNVLRLYTARNGSLVGYAAFLVAPHRHYQDSLQATQDLVYLAPKVRKGWTGIEFLEWCDGQLKDEGVSVVYHFSSAKRDIGPVLEWAGYEKIQDMYGRKL